MEIKLLCNAGLAITYEGKTLLIDIPNREFSPFAALPSFQRQMIMNRTGEFGAVCGMFITHDHPDHCDMERVRVYRSRWSEVNVFVPDNNTPQMGTVVMGPFVISYQRMDHAPMDVPTPPHVVAWVRVGDKTVYIAADAKLDHEEHRRFLKGRVANYAFWNAMYLSRPETRLLIREAAQKSFIYHMPEVEPDSFGIWKKCRNNLLRYENELQSVTVLDRYPYIIEL